MGAFIVLVAFSACDDHHAGADGIPISSDQFLRELDAQGAADMHKIGIPRIDHFTEHEVSVTWVLQPSPILREDAAESASEALATLSVKVLMAHGFNPHAHDTNVSVTMEQPAGKSLTGTKQVRAFGFARYSWSSDSVEWVPFND